MENQLTVNPREFGLEENKALELTSGLTTILAERDVLKNAYIGVIELELTEENLQTFKDLCLRIRNNRTKGIEVWHKTNKEFFLTGGRFVDAIKNKEIAENERMENKLLEAEKHFENLEKERLKAIHNERLQKLLPFDYEIGTIDYSAMDENMFSAILLGAETSHKNKLEAERLIEEKRLENLRIEAEEKEKQRIEFERLKTENETKQKQLESERLEAKKIADELKLKADTELSELKRLADIETKKQNEIIAKQKADSEKLQSELKAKTDSELKAKALIEAERKAKELADKKLAKAPDKIKLQNYLISIPSLDFTTISMDSITIAQDINLKLEGFKKWANEQISNLRDPDGNKLCALHRSAE